MPVLYRRFEPRITSHSSSAPLCANRMFMLAAWQQGAAMCFNYVPEHGHPCSCHSHAIPLLNAPASSSWLMTIVPKARGSCSVNVRESFWYVSRLLAPETKLVMLACGCGPPYKTIQEPTHQQSASS